MTIRMAAVAGRRLMSDPIIATPVITIAYFATQTLLRVNRKTTGRLDEDRFTVS